MSLLAFSAKNTISIVEEKYKFYKGENIMYTNYRILMNEVKTFEEKAIYIGQSDKVTTYIFDNEFYEMEQKAEIK